MDKKISELDQALQINNDAVFPISQDNGGTDTTYKVSITQISAEIGEDQTFSNLDTTDKTLVGAINEVAQGGGGGGSSTLEGLTDVDIDDQTLSDGQVLKYDSVEEKWVNDDVGAGGHTIVADDGTDLAQRANLQFIGAYSEDNSVDDTTEVNVVRNMTRAQFNQLSADEKTGLINITDESLDATQIPIQSGSATNTKDYIDTGLSGKADTTAIPTRSDFIRYEDKTVGAVEFTQPYFAIPAASKPSVPSGYMFLMGVVRDYGSIQSGTSAVMNVDAVGGNYLFGITGSKYSNVLVRYIYIKN